MLQMQSRLGILNRRFDLAPVPDDGGILHQALDISAREFCDHFGLKVFERDSECRTFAQYRQPT